MAKDKEGNEIAPVLSWSENNSTRSEDNNFVASDDASSYSTVVRNGDDINVSEEVSNLKLQDGEESSSDWSATVNNGVDLAGSDDRNELKNQLKQTKKNNKNRGKGNSNDEMFILAVILAILIPPLGVLIYTNIDWMKVLICLLLTVLFFLPGMIYALLVVFDYI